jgi:single-strand DNA-binding protein
MNGSNVTAMGRLVRDPEVKFTTSGTAVSNCTIALKSSYKDGDDSFIDLVVWGKAAEFLGQWAKKGARIFVSGELEQQRWEKKDGTKASKIVVKVNAANLIDWPEKDEEPSGDPTRKMPVSHDEEDVPF